MEVRMMGRSINEATWNTIAAKWVAGLGSCYNQMLEMVNEPNTARDGERVTAELANAGFKLNIVSNHVACGASFIMASSSEPESTEELLIVETIMPGLMNLTAFAKMPERARELLAAAVALFPEKELPSTGHIPIRFWRKTPHGARAHMRFIACPALTDIRANYSPEVFTYIAHLADARRPDDFGRITLWHGPPGTGKTYAIRALARAWHRVQNASIEVVLDPEELFGDAAYLYDVMLAGDFELGVEEEQSNEDYEGPPLRMIIVEDSARLFAKDCRQRPGFDRLLNLSDGLIGQGLRAVFLFSANEDLEIIDPALLRPGRCLGQLFFGPLDADDANRWLDLHGKKGETTKQMTIAELYASA